MSGPIFVCTDQNVAFMLLIVTNVTNFFMEGLALTNKKLVLRFTFKSGIQEWKLPAFTALKQNIKMDIELYFGKGYQNVTSYD